MGMNTSPIVLNVQCKASAKWEICNSRSSCNVDSNIKMLYFWDKNFSVDIINARCLRNCIDRYSIFASSDSCYNFRISFLCEFPKKGFFFLDQFTHWFISTTFQRTPMLKVSLVLTLLDYLLLRLDEKLTIQAEASSASH